VFEVGSFIVEIGIRDALVKYVLENLRSDTRDEVAKLIPGYWV
jgi:hypothetical protein